MYQNIDVIHKVLTLHGSCNDMIFLEHFYVISVLKSYLLTKKGESLLRDFLDNYANNIEEQLLIVYYLLENESAFCLYFKEPLKTITNFISQLEAKVSNQDSFLKQEISNIQYILKKYPLLFQTEKENDALYETMEMDSRALLLNEPKNGLKTCFIVDAAVYQVLLRKQPFHQLKPLLKGESLYYVLGSIHKLLCDLLGILKTESTYCLQDWSYLDNIIQEFFPYAQDDISFHLVELIKILLEDEIKLDEQEKGKILKFKRKEFYDQL